MTVTYETLRLQFMYDAQNIHTGAGVCSNMWKMVNYEAPKLGILQKHFKYTILKLILRYRTASCYGSTHSYDIAADVTKEGA